MPAFDIITDSTANLTQKLIRENSVIDIPFPYFTEGKEPSFCTLEEFDDVKYYADIKNGASGGFSEEHKNDFKNVIFEEDVKNALPEDILFSLREVLSLDPKPQYKTGGKVYKMTFGEYEISFLSDGDDITVTNAARRGKYVPDTKGI